MVSKESVKAIREAIRNGDVEQFVELIGSDRERLNARTVFGTWLHVAASFGKLNIVKRLLELGADINAPGGISGGRPIEEAAAEGHLEIVRYLITHGADLDVRAPETNPLFSAIYGGHTEVVELLVDSGIDVSIVYTGPNKPQVDALAYARERGQKEIESFLSSRINKVSPISNSVPRDEVISTMTQHFGPVQKLGLDEILVIGGIRINVIPPRSPSQPVILFTTGMSNQVQSIGDDKEEFHYSELLMRLPSSWPVGAEQIRKPEYYWPIKWMKQIAYDSRRQGTWRGGPVTIVSNGDPPEPLGPGTALTCIMLSPDPQLEAVVCSDGKKIVFYSLFPLYTEECNLEKAHGVAALFDCLTALNISLVVDPLRENAAKPKPEN
jgi:hypothetical protein